MLFASGGDESILNPLPKVRLAARRQRGGSGRGEGGKQGSQARKATGQRVMEAYLAKWT
jgi:hypothetical protein